MPNQILENFAREIPEMEKQLDEARELIAVMAEAGEPTAEMKKEMAATEMRLNKWKNTLKARGIEIGG